MILSQRLLFACVLLLAPTGLTVCAADAKLELKQGDHICLIGNTLAERMQHANHWETLLYQRFPQLQLTVRNLGYSADELTLRPRSENFGSPDDHLRFSKADVVMAFFGFNESFAGPAGLDKFRNDLNEFITHTLSQQYNGTSAPRLVLVSPIAHEDLHSPDLPDGSQTNANLQLYTQAMKEIAAERQVPFVDLFTPTTKLFAPADSTYTINGVHLSDDGDRLVGGLLDEGLFGEAGGTRQFDERLRAAIADKNFQWFNRYRAINGFYIYGGRSRLTFADGPQTNHDVMEREREVLDAMTANRDHRIWALARGDEAGATIDDSNLPPFLPVTGSYGVGRANPDGRRGQSSKNSEVDQIDYLPVAEAVKKFELAKGYKIEAFASEEQFPELVYPTQFTFDARGRLWVCCMPSYPQYQPGEKQDDYVLILEDVDGDGQADKCTRFAGGLHVPTGLELVNDGLVVISQPDLLFLKDTDGDDVADIRERVLHGFDTADSHHTASAFTLDPAGALYFCEGTFHHSQVETPYGPTRCVNSGAFRYEPRTQKLDVYVTYNFANPWGLAFDYWGQSFLSDASGGANYFATAFSGRLPYPEKHNGMQQWFPMRVRPTAGCEFVSSRHFPDEAQGNFLLNNCIGVQGVLQHTTREEGSGFVGQEIEPLVISSDPNFRPVDIEFAPDGSLYLCDWHHAIIGHMQYSLRDPARETRHGRIYRVTYPGRPLLQPTRLDKLSVAELLDQLTLPEDRQRLRARQELGRRSRDEVLSAVAAWQQKWNPEAVEDQHALLEALWVHANLNVVNEPLLLQLLHSPEPRARAAATRVLCYWRDRVTAPLDLLRELAHDPHPRVRLEAVRTCSFFSGPQAVAVAAEVLASPMDYYLDYTLNETLRALLRAPSDVFVPEDESLAKALLARVPSELLRQAEDSAAVAKSLLVAKDLTYEKRQEALAQVARLNRTSPAAAVTAALVGLNPGADDQNVLIGELAKLLTSSEVKGLQREQAKLLELAKSPSTAIRRAAWAGVIAGATRPEAVWELAGTDVSRQLDVIEGLWLVPDPVKRATYQPLLVAELQRDGIDESLQSTILRTLPLLRGYEADHFALLTKYLLADKSTSGAVQGLLQLPKEVWTKEAAATIADFVVQQAAATPTEQRTEDRYLELVQLGQQAATLLDVEEAAKVRRTLRQLGVPVFVLKAVYEQMRYSQSRLVVEAGKPVQIIFENPDVMLHNLVIVKPGSREEVGLAAARMSPQPDYAGRVYVPANPNVLAATRMLASGQRQALAFNAPNEPGEYEYVCTYPGHWMRMYGKLMVVPDVEEYLRTAPPEEEVKVTEWKLADFTEDLKQLDQGRSYEQGRDLFLKAACAQCHAVGNDGNNFGPSLVGVLGRYKNRREGVLEAVLEPSKTIEEKYRSIAHVLDSGRTVTGMVIKTDDDTITVQTGPTPNTIEVLNKSEIEDSAPQSLSLMPAGLLKTLSREQVLDLLMFVIAEGNPKHPAYSKSAGGHHNH